MEFNSFKTFEHNSISAGSTVSGSWTADDDYIIRKIYIVEKSGATINASTLYFKVGGDVYTHEFVSAKVLGPQQNVTPLIDIEITKGEKFDYTFKNNESSAVSIFIVLELWKK